MSAALLIDILLWSSVFGVGLIAFRRGPPVFKASLREGELWRNLGDDGVRKAAYRGG
ncbi:hypothetical protein [Bradyrhizobium liaoningense]|uniref:hypothetical protein n=1 Tax=Bradyrhizobium liaoningense TaxID=43992 RepID=UPI001BAD3C00|nr:hypothetical protein [Bradyrhizobium liaoningense]MBR0944540.1 hypothetical protein [Bradyrhizobium liaoningense]